MKLTFIWLDFDGFDGGRKKGQCMMKVVQMCEVID